MKKLIFLMLLPLIAFGQVKMSQTQYGDGLEYYIYATTVDSGAYTQEFSLEDFDVDLFSYPLSYALKLDTLTNDTGTEIIGVYIQGYRVDGWTNVDTLSAADTLNASHALASATWYKSGALNLNAYSLGVFPRYRLYVIASHAKTDYFSFYVRLYATKRD